MSDTQESWAVAPLIIRNRQIVSPCRPAPTRPQMLNVSVLVDADHVTAVGATVGRHVDTTDPVAVERGPVVPGLANLLFKLAKMGCRTARYVGALSRKSASPE